MAVILLVEDERDLSNVIRTQLEGEGHTVHQAFDGPSALTLADQHILHLVILDWMLPGLDGLSVCRQLRRDHLMPIIMLTARTEEIDRVLGLEVGADDYVTKPFSMRELLARVRAMLRRVELDTRAISPLTATPNNDGDLPSPQPIIHGGLHINLVERIVTLDNEELELTPKEFELLVLLTSHPGRAFSREFLLQQIWGYDSDSMDRTVDSHMTRLRKKLGPYGEKIVAVWGVGYRFTV
jgi:DNA-binding response OmpR family regulator